LVSYKSIETVYDYPAEFLNLLDLPGMPFTIEG